MTASVIHPSHDVIGDHIGSLGIHPTLPVLKYTSLFPLEQSQGKTSRKGRTLTITRWKGSSSTAVSVNTSPFGGLNLVDFFKNYPHPLYYCFIVYCTYIHYNPHNARLCLPFYMSFIFFSIPKFLSGAISFYFK